MCVFMAGKKKEKKRREEEYIYIITSDSNLHGGSRDV